MDDWASIGEYAWVYSLDKISVGKNACIGQHVRLLTAGHDVDDVGFRLSLAPISVLEGAWVASGAHVLPGVKIGRFAVIGCASVVTKDVPDLQVWAGNPAAFIRLRKLPKKEDNA